MQFVSHNVECYKINFLLCFVSVDFQFSPSLFFDYSLYCPPWELKWLLQNCSVFQFSEELAMIFIPSLVKQTLQTPSTCCRSVFSEIVKILMAFTVRIISIHGEQPHLVSGYKIK